MHGLHCFAALGLQLLLIAAVPTRLLHPASFAAQFAYLAFFRTCDYAGIPIAPAHTNAILMIMTIKLIGVALEIAESRAVAAAADSELGKNISIRQISEIVILDRVVTC